ncbi:MAG: GntR family transcriptional regulator [Acidobacteriota bacterium]|nr:GntR family transcriptional regulator [Acidobacteriota bacterium]
MRDEALGSVVERRTVAEDVYRGLKRDIIMLRHRPGASLTETELAGLYGSSRVPVREACSRLQQEGLLTSLPYKGYFVNQISLKEIGDSFDLRDVLETHAIELAARRATPDERERLTTLAATEYTYHDWASYADFLDRNFDFHIQLAALSRNDRLVAVLRDLLSTMQRYFFLGLDLGDFATEMRTEHEELVQLLQPEKAEEAADCLRQQIHSSRDRIMRALIDDRIDLPLE